MAKRLTENLAVCLGSIVLFLVVTELILTILAVDPHPRGRDFTVNRAPDYPEVFLKDSRLIWRLRPGQKITSEFFKGKTYQINRQGFRGSDFDPDHPGIRIAVIGNSCAFGWGVGYRETFGYLLQKKLRSAGYDNAHIYNFSVPGYSSFQGRHNYLENVRPYKPDILIMTFGWNDQWVAANARPDKEQELPPESVVALQNFLARFRFYRLSKSLVFSILPEEDFESSPKLARVSLKDFKTNLGEIVDSARADGTRVVLLTSPIPSLATYYKTTGRSFLHENHLFYNDAIRETAAIYSAGLVDLAGIFNDYNNLFDDIERDPFHYNRNGHYLAAEEIFKFLTESGFLKEYKSPH